MAGEFTADVAVVIGIAAYDRSLGVLETPVRDAKAIAKLLAGRFGYQVILQCDGTATLPGLLTLLQELPKHVPQDSRLLFYFAGHGVALPNAEVEGPEGYLVPYGATTEADSHLPMRKLHEALAKLPCRHLLVILDCCFSGAFRWAGHRPGLIPEEILYEECYQKWLRHPSRWALASAAHDEHSFDPPDRRRGQKDDLSPFASALRDGLRGKADLGENGGDGVITLAELYAYLLNRLAPLQTPLITPLPGQSKGAFVFRDLHRVQPLVSAEQMVLLKEEENPYQGLESYGAGQAEFFFGRTKTARRLLHHVRLHPLTVVAGPSGCGKSSLVQAGLQARLQARSIAQRRPRRGRMAGWIVPPPLRVSLDPFLALAETLAAAGGPPPPSPDELRSDPVAAKSWSSAWVASHPCERLLLVVDQAEELITRVPSDHAAKPGDLPAASAGFLACLGTLLEAGAGRLRILIAVRSDYEPDLEPSSETDPLTPLWNTGRFVVPLLSRDELREVIEGPAGRKALYFDDPALVEQLIDEVAGMPGGLPLLSYALSRLYLAYLKNERRDRLLTAADLASIGSGGSGTPGGIVRILREEADRAVSELPSSAHQEVLWRILLRMVHLAGARPTRRQVPLSELDYFRSGENDRREKVLRRFIEKERLLVTGRDGIEPAHDELLVSWSQLTKKIDAARDRIPVHRRLTETAAAWDARPDPPRKGLDLRLLELVEGIFLPVEWLNRAEMSYLTAAREERRSRARLQWRLVALAFLLTIGAALFLFVQNQRNIKLRYQSTIQSLINQAEADLATGQTARGLLLARQAYGFLPRSEGDLAGRVDQLFRRVLDDLPPSRVVIRDEEDPNPVAFHPTGRLLVASQRGTLVQLTLPEDGIEPAGPARPLPGAPDTRIQAVAFSADGRWLAAGFGGGELCVWRLAGAPPAPLPGDHLCVEAGPAPFSRLAFQPGTSLLEAEREGSEQATGIQIWKLAGGPGVPRLRRLPDRPVVAVQDPAGSADGTVQPADSRLPSLCRNDATAVAVAPRGLKIAVACDRALRLWDLRPGQGGWNRGVGRQRLQVPFAAVLAARPGHPGVLAVGQASGDVELHDAATRATSRLPRPLFGLLGLDPGGLTPHCQGPGVASLVWSPDGKILHTLGKDGLWRWQTPEGEPRTRWLGGCVCSAAGSADGSWLAVLLEVMPGQMQLEVLPGLGEGEEVALGVPRSSVADRCKAGLAFHPRRPELLVGLGSEISLWTRSATGTWQPQSLAETDGPIFAAVWAEGRQGEDLPVVGGRGSAVEGFVEVLDSLGRRRHRWTFAEAPVSGLAFDPGSRQLAAAASGGGLNLLDLDAPGAVPTVLGPAKSSPESPTFLGSSQIAALLDEEVSLWKVGTGSLAKATCDTAASNLDFNDWTSYVDPAPDHYEMACPGPAIGPHPSVMAFADSLASTGQGSEAQRIYRRLNELKPGMVVNPSRRARAQRLASELSRFNATDRERVLAGMRRAEEYEELRQAEGLLPPSEKTLLRLCRWGTVLGEPRRALPFCGTALELLPGNGMAHDSRGLTRAVLGDLRGAREDFLVSRDWLNEPAWRQQRQDWIDALAARRNPITPEVLGQITREELGLEPPRNTRRAAQQPPHAR